MQVKVGIVGGTGYTAGELLRILCYHPYTEIVGVVSGSKVGEKIATVHHDLFWFDHSFVNELPKEVDVVFLCLPHGESKAYLQKNPHLREGYIIDLGNDFRLAPDQEGFQYGLPEIYSKQIKESKHIANPGCFATAIQLALIPLAASNLLSDEIHLFGVTGSTGAGRALGQESHYSTRNSNLSNYKVFTHQHLGEISQQLSNYQSGIDLFFVPTRGCHTRGIMVNCVVKCSTPMDQLLSIYNKFYEDAPYVSVTSDVIHLKDIVNTNHCRISLTQQGDKLLITSMIDNLLKGAAGQAVENMNILLGIDRTCGLQLKPSFF